MKDTSFTFTLDGSTRGPSLIECLRDAACGFARAGMKDGEVTLLLQADYFCALHQELQKIQSEQVAYNARDAEVIALNTVAGRIYVRAR